MERREFIKASLAALLLAREGRADTSASRPNVLLMSDDMNNDFGGVSHLADVKVPHLARLSREGVRFERAYCQYPVCNPSRVSLLRDRDPYELKNLIAESQYISEAAELKKQLSTRLADPRGLIVHQGP